MQCFKKSGEIFGKLVFNQPLTVALLLCALFVYLFLLLCSLRSALVCWFKNCALVCAAAPKSMLHMHAGVGVPCCVQLYACVCVCWCIRNCVYFTCNASWLPSARRFPRKSHNSLAATRSLHPLSLRVTFNCYPM